MFDLTRYQRDHTCRKRTCLLPVVAHVMLNFESSSCSGKKKVSDCSERLHLKECRSLGSLGHPERQEISKRQKNRKANCYTLLKRITRLKCEFGIQVSRHSPQTGLPHLALWHHVGVNIGITLDKNGSFYDPAGTESCDMQIRLVSYYDKDEYIYIYRTTVATSCDL